MLDLIRGGRTLEGGGGGGGVEVVMLAKAIEQAGATIINTGIRLA